MNKSGLPVDSDNTRAIGVGDDDDLVGVRDIDCSAACVDVFNGDGRSVVENSSDSDATVGVVVEGDAIDGNVIGQEKFHEFPPVGKKLVGPKSEYERMPDGTVRYGTLPLDPARTWRVVPCDWKPTVDIVSAQHQPDLIPVKR